MKQVLVTGGLCSAMLSLPGMVSPVRADVPEEARDGARLYGDSAFVEAADAFRQATIAAPGDPRWRYDLGLSEAQSEDFENALNNLAATARIADSAVAGDAWFNAGNVHYAMGNFAGAADAYRSSLLLDPSDGDAKRNLELALKQIQEQQSQSEEEQQDQDQEQDQGGDEEQDSEQNDQQQDPEQEDPSQQQQGQDSTGQDQPDQQPTDPQAQSDSTLTREQAERILRALADEEARLRNQARKLQVLPAPGGKDW